MAAPVGTQLQTEEAVTLDSMRWSYYDDDPSPVIGDDGEVVHVTLGQGLGYRTVASNASGHFNYSHTSPDSRPAKVWSNLIQRRAELLASTSLPVPSISVPKATVIAEIGMTGGTFGPHVHYERPNASPSLMLD